MKQGQQATMMVIAIKENVGRWKDDYKHEIKFINDEGEVYTALHMLPNVNEVDFQINRKITFEVKAEGHAGKLDLIRPVEIRESVAPATSQFPCRTYSRERLIEAQSAFRIATDIAISEGTSTELGAIRARARDIMLQYHSLADEVEGILNNQQ